MQKSEKSVQKQLTTTLNIEFIYHLSQPALLVDQNYNILKVNNAFSELFSDNFNNLKEILNKKFKFNFIDEIPNNVIEIEHPTIGYCKASILSTSHSNQYLLLLDEKSLQKDSSSSSGDEFFYISNDRLIFPLYKKLKILEQITGLAYLEVVDNKENLRYSKNLLSLLALEDEGKIVTLEDFFSFIHPQDRGVARAMYNDCKEGLNDDCHEIRIINTHNNLEYIKIDYKNLSEQEDCIMLILQDNSSQKMLELALRDNEALFRSIFEQAAVGITQISPKGELLMFNQKMCEILGYKPEDLSLTNYKNFTHPDDLEKDRLIEQNIFANKLSEGVFEKRFLHKNGKTIWAKVYLTVIRDEQNSAKYAVGIVDDISEGKKAEQQIVKQNEDLIRLNSEMDNFVYRTSHDLRAPLASVLGLVYLLKREKDQNNKDEYISMIENSVKRLDNSIHEILDLSRNSRIDFEYGLVSLRNIINTTFNSLTHVKGYENIKINIELNDEDFYSDEKRIKMIFGNLLSNAVNYQNKYCSSSYIKIEGIINDKLAIINISDNGVGIEKKHLKNIFKMFYRANDHTTGSGLGLYIVKEAVDKLNGKIDVKSKAGDGTSFTLQIPNQKQIFII
jgi:PAS domain S-box-containing protein